MSEIYDSEILELNAIPKSITTAVNLSDVIDAIQLPIDPLTPDELVEIFDPIGPVLSPEVIEAIMNPANDIPYRGPEIEGWAALPVDSRQLVINYLHLMLKYESVLDPSDIRKNAFETALATLNAITSPTVENDK